MERRRLAVEAGKGEDADMEPVESPVREVTRAHFEEAFALARRSVTVHDLQKFEDFRKKNDPAYAKKKAGESGRPKINWPEDTSSQF